MNNHQTQQNIRFHNYLPKEIVRKILQFTDEFLYFNNQILNISRISQVFRIRQGMMFYIQQKQLSHKYPKLVEIIKIYRNEKKPMLVLTNFDWNLDYYRYHFCYCDAISDSCYYVTWSI